MKKIILLALILSACGPQVGQTGAPGINGQDGKNGSDGTLVTPIQFCPGVTPIYPTTFPESGLCIEGNLYAVYSTHGGFLTLIPPGEYRSNAVGSACDFSVLDNCRIE